MLRVVALYSSKPVMVRVLYATLFASYLTTLGLLLRAQVFLSEHLEYSEISGICATASRAKTLAAVFYAPLGFDLLLCSLTIYHAWNDYQEHHTQLGSAVLPLFRLMYRDGTTFSAIMVVIRVWNIFIETAQPLSRTYLGIYLMWSAITVLCSRIYLNVVQMARSNESDRLPPYFGTNSKIQARYASAISLSNSSPSEEFPRRVERSIPIARRPAVDGNHYYSMYFRDQLTLD